MEVSSADRSAVQGVVEQLAAAWNRGDGAAFAAPFAEDAEQINIYGTQLIRRRRIAEMHAHVFSTMFRGSTNSLEVLDVQRISNDVLVAKISSSVSVPAGPLQGELRTIGSLVLCRSGSGWEIALFHNTRVAEMP